MTAEAPVLEGRGLAKRYGGKRALVDVDLTLRPHRIQGVIGPNGSGKSTLIGVMAGAVVADAGSVVLAGSDVSRLKARQRASAGIGRTFQTPQIFESLTLARHIELARAPGADDWGREVAAHLGLDDALDRPVGTFSHGLRRLAEICHVAATRPRVLLLDEPAAGLTAYEMGLLDRALRWLRERLAVCLVEHNMQFLLGVTDHVTVLENGAVIATGTPDEITENPEVRRAYLGSSYTRGPAVVAAGRP